MSETIVKMCNGGGELSIKRFYVEGGGIEIPCPGCKEILEAPNGYLSYPTIGVPEKLVVYCYECADAGVLQEGADCTGEFTIGTLQLDIQLTYVLEPVVLKGE